MNDLISKASSTKTYHCPSCKRAMRRIEGIKGPFWGCSAYPECTASYADKNNRPDF